MLESAFKCFPPPNKWIAGSNGTLDIKSTYCEPRLEVSEVSIRFDIASDSRYQIVSVYSTSRRGFISFSGNFVSAFNDFDFNSNSIFLTFRARLISSSRERKTRSERVGRNRCGDEKRSVGKLSSDSINFNHLHVNF